jgi:hypothetical protein
MVIETAKPIAEVARDLGIHNRQYSGFTTLVAISLLVAFGLALPANLG